MGTSVHAPPAHRLVLTAAELALLVDKCAVAVPSGFGGDSPADEAALRGAAQSLSARRVVIAGSDDPLDCQPVTAVAANLAVLSGPVVTVRVEVSVGDRRLRAAYAISGPLCASLFALSDGAVELSMFPAISLGRELIRAVPAADELVTPKAAVWQALSNGTDRPLSGRLPLAALEGYDPAHTITERVAAGDEAALGLTAEQATLADQLTRRTTGMLQCQVTGMIGDEVVVGQVVWLATGNGWVALRPDPDGDGVRMITLRPVAREDIGTWVAPYVAGVLEASSERP